MQGHKTVKGDYLGFRILSTYQHCQNYLLKRTISDRTKPHRTHRNFDDKTSIYVLHKSICYSTY
jgi:hypothetical protein